MNDAFEARAVEGGTVTRSFVEGKMDAVVERIVAKLDSASHNGQSSGSVDGSSTHPTTQTGTADPRRVLYEWNGKLRRLPRDCLVVPPNGTLAAGFDCWVHGTDKIRPFREVRSVDLGDDDDPEQRNRRRAFAHYQNLIQKMETHLKEKGLWIEDPTLIQCRSMYESALPALPIEATTVKERPRNMAKMKWTTITKDLRTIEAVEAKAARKRRARSVGGRVGRRKRGRVRGAECCYTKVVKNRVTATKRGSNR